MSPGKTRRRMGESRSEDAPPEGPSLWLVALLTATVLAGLLTAPAAGARDGDFVHLWLGGHALWSVGPSALYDPVQHRMLLEAVFGGAPPDALWAGRNDLLGAFFYPPPMALPYALFGALPLRVAATAHAMVAVVGAVCAGWTVARLSGLGRVAAIVLVLTTPALFHNHVLGQNGVWTLLAMGLGGWLLARKSDLLGGMVLGLLLCKPSWLLAVGWVPVVLGRTRAVVGMAISALGLVVLSSLVPGLEAWGRWLELLPRLAALDQAGDYPLHLQYSLWGLARRVVGLGRWGDLLGAFLSLVLVVLTTARLRHTQASWSARIALGLCAASLVNPHLHPYDVTGGIFAVAVLLARPATRRTGWVLLVLHHGGQALEGLQGSGWALAPGTLGLMGAWTGLWHRMGDNGGSREDER